MINDKTYYNQFSRTQYEDIALKFDTMKTVYARFIRQREYTHQGNDLIEALPPMKTEEESFLDFEYRPYYDPNERNYPDNDRALAILRLDDFRVARDYTACLDDAIAIALRRCYSARKKFDFNTLANLEKTGRYFNDTEYKRIDGKKVQGFTVVGVSGGGKSTSISTALQYYPQVIIHENENSRQVQVVYLKVECPADGSIKAFYDACFQALEGALGNGMNEKRSARTVDEKAMLFKKLALRNLIGLLIIEEIQNLSIKREDTMNQFLTLANETQIPIIFVGTYKACRRVFDIDFRLGRRGGQIIEVKRFPKDKSWDRLMTELWKYQWLREVVPLTQEIKDKFYEETGGIIDRVINLFQMIQLDAIQTEYEKITLKSIESISIKYFSTTRKMLLSLNDENSYVLYEDLYSPRSTKENKIEMLTNIKLRAAQQILFDNNRIAEVESLSDKRMNVIRNIRNIFGDQYSIKKVEDAFDKLVKLEKQNFSSKTEQEMNGIVIKALFNNVNSKQDTKRKIEEEIKLNVIEGLDSFENV